ncbi:MAG: flagellar biosynthesis protein FlhF [Gammaproteobacteria bacterium]|nr:MAG: flagellar biosynthesis protein FlhF [Gammaproteobacteria bacterium]
MRIKRYFGKNIRNTLQKVRAEQGPDAVILSNRKVEGGVEMIAAVDFEEVLLADHPAMNVPAPAVSQPTPKARSVPLKKSAPIRYKPSPAVVTRHGAQVLATKKKKPAAASAKPRVAMVKKQDGAEFGAMRNELKHLRNVLEHQLSGLVWGDVARRNPAHARLLRRLLDMELSPKLCQRIVQDLAAGRVDLSWRNALGTLAHKVKVTDDDILSNGGVVALVGPTGVGKTTTIAKLAARFAVRHGTRHVALVTTDNYRVGAQEHLRAYARILDVPLRVAGTREELKETLNDLSDRKLVLIDTAGMSQRDVRLTEQLAIMRAGASKIKSYLVLPATSRAAVLHETIRTFGRVSLRGCILTKVDEVGSLGSALSVLINHQLPVAYISDGQRVPEDLYAARAHSLVSRSVKLMNHALMNHNYGAMAMAMN